MILGDGMYVGRGETPVVLASCLRGRMAIWTLVKQAPEAPRDLFISTLYRERGMEERRQEDMLLGVGEWTFMGSHSRRTHTVI